MGSEMCIRDRHSTGTAICSARASLSLSTNLAHLRKRSAEANAAQTQTGTHTVISILHYSCYRVWSGGVVCRRRLAARPSSLNSATAAAFMVRPCSCSCLVAACNAFHAEPFGFVTSVKVAFQVIPSFPSYITDLHHLVCLDGRSYHP